MATPNDTILSTADLLTLVESGRELASQIDLDVLLQNILRKATELTDSRDSSVILHNDRRNTLYFAGATGANAEMLLKKWGEFSLEQIPVEGSQAGEVFTSRQSIIIGTMPAQGEHFAAVDQTTQSATESMVCVPLLVAGDPLGVMQILNRRVGQYTERDRVILEHFAAQAAVAIRNARMFEDLVAQMGLYSSRREGQSLQKLLQELYRPAWTEVLSIFFADMRGFTRLCQVLNSPEMVQRMLNQFMTMLVTQVIQHKGTVNKFLGDGLLALFRGEGHAREAALCAFGAAEEFAAMHGTWNSEVNAQLDFLDIGFGIATDQVIIGTIGAARARDFTVMGTAVNLAAALQNRARGGKRILVDQMTYSAVKELVAETEGPETFELRKPDQPTGPYFKQYHLKTLARPNRIFVSHSHLDRDFVETQLVRPLKACRIDTWYSRESIGPGEVWVRSIPEGLAKCNWVVVVVSKNAAESDWVKEEIELAKSQTGGFRGRIIPVVLDDTPPEEISPWLRQIQAINAQEEGQLANRIHEIIKARGNR